MITVIILNKGEDNVTKLTYENLWRELKDIPKSELLVSEDWFDYLPDIKNKYVCFVEPDCLVSSGYFESQIGLFKKNPLFRKLAMLSATTAVNDWHNRFYGYTLADGWSSGIAPNRTQKSNQVYPVQIAYVPGSIIRMTMLKRALNDTYSSNMNLIELSMRLSLAFWAQGDGNRVHLNPNATYVTTEDYVNDLGRFIPSKSKKLNEMFEKESI